MARGFRQSMLSILSLMANKVIANRMDNTINYSSVARIVTLPFTLATCLVPVAFVLSSNAQTTPNFVEETVFDVDGVAGSGNAAVAKSFSDGLGRDIQSQVKSNVQQNVMVGGKEYDAAGRPYRSPKAYPVPDISRSFITGSLVDAANDHYANYIANPSAYSETQYYDDPLNRVKAAGAPGTEFSISAHPVKTWSLGVTGNNAFSTVKFDATTGFVLPANLKGSTPTEQDNTSTLLEWTIPGEIDTYIDGDPTNRLPQFKYFLSITMDQNGNFTQSMTDLFGRTIRTAASAATGTGNLIISQAEYNINGELRAQIPPLVSGNTVNSSTTTYNTAGQVISKYTPDASTVNYYYDDDGNLVRTVDASCNGNNAVRSSIDRKYDAFGRLETVGEVISSKYYVRVRTIYDDLSNAVPYVSDAILAAVGTLENTIGRPVASIALDANYKPAAPTDADEKAYPVKVIDFFSYDDKGRTKTKYCFVYGVADYQKTTFTYDIHGKVLNVSRYTGAASTPDLYYDYSYNADGAVGQISKNGTQFAGYAYDQYGQLSQKTFYLGGQSYAVDYSYDLLKGWVKTINANNSQYIERLCYEVDNIGNGTGFKPQYNGNIARAKTTMSGNADPGATPDLLYTYDFMNRLTNVDNFNKTDAYDANFSYLDDGRILQKHEGGTEQSAWGNYQYTSGTNRLSGISSSGSREGANYIYDNIGNMVLDRSKKMTVEYDWRNMPVRFNIYDNIPSSVIDLASMTNINTDPNTHRLHEIFMLYDASGNRVKKEEVQPLDVVAPTDPALTSADGSFVVTMDVTGTIYKFKSDGTMLSSKSATSEMSGTESGALLWQHNDGSSDITMVAFNSSKLQVQGGVSQNNSTNQTGDLLLYYNPEPSAPKLLVDHDIGTLKLAGTNTKRTVSSGTAYVDGRVLMYSPSTTSYALSYTEGPEGVVRPDGNFEAYIKDHLGSTRMVVYNNGGTIAIKEAFAYYAYGTQKSIGNTVPQDARARMGFTGKEFDKAGGDASDEGVDVSLTITDFDPACITSPVPAILSLVFNEGMAGTLYNQFYFNISGTTATLNGHVKVNNNAKLTSIRLGAYTNLADSTRTWNTVIDVNETMTAGKRVQITFPGGSKRIGDIVLGTGGPRGSWVDPYSITVRNVVAGISLDYFGRRYYDPEVGVWTACDPKGQYFNSYGYSSNPIVYVDPDGTFFGLFYTPALFDFAFTTLAGAAIGTGITYAIDPKGFKDNWWKGALIGGAVGAGAWLGSEHIRNFVDIGKFVSDQTKYAMVKTSFETSGLPVTVNGTDITTMSKNTKWKTTLFGTSHGPGSTGEQAIALQRKVYWQLSSKEMTSVYYGRMQVYHELTHVYKPFDEDLAYAVQGRVLNHYRDITRAGDVINGQIRGGLLNQIQGWEGMHWDSFLMENYNLQPGQVDEMIKVGQ